MAERKLAVVRNFPKAYEIEMSRFATYYKHIFVTQPDFGFSEIRPVPAYCLLPDFAQHLPFMSSYHFTVFRNLESALEDVDAINAAELFTFMSRQCSMISSRLKIKFVASVWQTIPNHLLYNFLPPYVNNTRFVINRTQLFLALTKKAISYLQSLRVPSDKIRLLYPGVDLQLFKPSAHRREDSSFIVLFVGRLERQKGIITLVSAFLQFAQENPDAQLWIIGRGKLLPEIVWHSKRSPNIIYKGSNLSQRLIIATYQRCDALCLPTSDYQIAGIKIWEEQFGMVLVEAMACQLPILATNNGAIPEILGHNNIIVPQDSTRGLLGGLMTLASDPELRRAIGKANRIRAEKLFDVVKQGEKMDRYLKEAIET